MNQLYKGRKVTTWELQGQLTGCSTSINLQRHNPGNAMQLFGYVCIPIATQSCDQFSKCFMEHGGFKTRDVAIGAKEVSEILKIYMGIDFEFFHHFMTYQLRQH